MPTPRFVKRLLHLSSTRDPAAAFDGGRSASDWADEGSRLLDLGRFDEALVRPDIPDRVRSVLHLRRGQAYDSLDRREEARTEYEATIHLNTDKSSHRLAKRYLKEPFQLSPGS